MYLLWKQPHNTMYTFLAKIVHYSYILIIKFYSKMFLFDLNINLKKYLQTIIIGKSY